MDLVLMSALSKLVAVVPVVAKADTMTTEEAGTYRDELLMRLADPNNFIPQSSSLPPITIKWFE